MPGNVVRVNFIIRDSSLKIGVPVHQPLTAVDQSVAEHLEERTTNGLAADFIQRKTYSTPVTTRTDLLELIQNASLVLILPLPDTFDQSLTTNVVPCQLFLFLHSTFNNRLSRNARVIRARHPQSGSPLHPSPASQQVLNCAVQTVPHVQRTGHVWQRNHDRVLFLARSGFGVAISLAEPVFNPASLCGGWFVGFWKFCGHWLRLQFKT